MEEDFIKKVNREKANNKMIVPILLLTLSILTYIIPLIYGEFDFGLIFEVISFIFLLVAKKHIQANDEKKAKKYVICSILSIGWLVIYDLIWLTSYILEGVDIFYLIYNFFFGEILSILSIAFLFSINKDLSINKVKHEDNKKWFYEQK